MTISDNKVPFNIFRSETSQIIKSCFVRSLSCLFKSSLPEEQDIEFVAEDSCLMSSVDRSITICLSFARMGISEFKQDKRSLIVQGFDVVAEDVEDM